MRIGFTGTRYGMTMEQSDSLFRWLDGPLADSDVFHHGCASGADEEVVLCLKGQSAVTIVAHPSTLSGWFSLAAKDVSDAVWPTKEPLDRNRDIVDNCDVLLACPDGPERVRSGTWATVRHARRCGKRVVIFWPDGTTTEENDGGQGRTA